MKHMVSSQKTITVKLSLRILFCCITLVGCLQGNNHANPSNGLIIEEHELRTRPDTLTEAVHFEVKTGSVEKVLAKHETYRDSESQLLEYNNKLLQPFGFRIELAQKQSFGVSALYSIYKGDQLYVEKPIFGFSPVSVNESKNKFIMSIDLSDGTYILTNDSLAKNQPGKINYYPIYIGNGLLGETHEENQTQFVLGEAVVYSGSVDNNTVTIPARLGPWGYNGHWALELPHQINNNGNWEYFGDIIQDGKSINISLGYEQSFGLAILNDIPFYFYQKDKKIGISYAQKEINTDYDEVLHYLCCSAGLLNPAHSQNMVWFFARRGETWYYVEAYTDIQ
jgi:hypothetical protein